MCNFAFGFGSFGNVAEQRSTMHEMLLEKKILDRGWSEKASARVVNPARNRKKLDDVT